MLLPPLRGPGRDAKAHPAVAEILKLKPGFTLPPLMFSDDEIEALSLGAQWVAERTDADLAGAARSALAKIAAVLPPRLRGDLDASTLMVVPSEKPAESQSLWG